MPQGVRHGSQADTHRRDDDAIVRIGPLMGIPALLQEFGHEPGPVIGSVGLTPGQFTDPDIEISYIAAGQLLAHCVALTGCEHFGLMLGMSAGPSSLGVAGFMLRSAPDVGNALRGLVQHLDLHDQGGAATLLIRGSETLLGYAIHQSGVKAADQIYDLAIAVGCNIMRALCGKAWKPAEVLLSHRQAQDLAPYRRFFRSPLRFNADQCAMVFPTHWLDQRNPAADTLLHRHLEREASHLHNLRKTGLASELRVMLRKSLAAGSCASGDIARQLHMHERTLNRKLHEEGTSFHRELDAIRYTMARQFLAESAMPIARIARVLNYAEVSAFSRAFKRWAGVSPAQWRKRRQTSA